MRILEMTATFGKLQKATLRPQPGFTVFHAPNEGGKSTWCAFLRAMLYGFPARDRDRAGYLAEKNRYQPWSGAAMEGSVTLSWQGRELTLRRGPKGNVPWGSFSAVWTATGEAVPGLTGENCGETLLGISREVFERTAFVGQGQSALSPSGELEKRVAALATSGQEDVSCSQVERRLKDWLNRRKVNSRVGLIPELENELSQVEAALAHQGELLRKAQETRQARELLEEKKTSLETRLQALTALANAQRAQKRREAQADYDAALSQLQGLQRSAQALPSAQDLRQAQGELAYLNTLKANLRQAEKAAPEAREKAEKAESAARADPFFGNLDAAQAAARAQRDRDEAERLGRKAWDPLLLLLLPLLASVGLTLWAYLQPRDPATSFPWWSILPLVLPVLWGASLLVVLPLVFLRRSRKRKAALLLARYEADSPDGILDRAKTYGQKTSEAQEARQACQAVEAELARLSGQRDELTGRLLDFVHPFAPEVTDLFGVSAALSRALQQGERYALAQARVEHTERLLSALPSPQAGELQPLPSADPTGEDPALMRSQLALVSQELSQISDAAARAQGELHALGDPAELEARRSQLLEELELRRGEYDAISAAMEALQAADSQLRERFSPAVNEKAGAYLSILTGGKYDKAQLTRQLQALAQEAGETMPRQDLSLSGGTVQQLYLALRLAMCELVLPQADPCPILLDDVLDAFDDERARLAVECLRRLGDRRQVILFSCHRRDEALSAT